MFSVINVYTSEGIKLSKEIMDGMLHNLWDFDPVDIVWIFVSPSRV